VIAPFEGAWLEDKTLALTIHCLSVKCDEKPLLRQCLSTALSRYDGLLTAEYSPASAEILPDIGWAKADLIRQVVEWQPGDTVPFYAAGDAADAPAFEVVVQAGGVSVGIGPSAASSAEHRLPDVESLARAIAALFNLLGSSPPIGAAAAAGSVTSDQASRTSYNGLSVRQPNW
jgi:trehalose-6-phosphatase